MEQKESKYYQNRLKDVQAIEKTMGEIAGMMNRLSQMTYEHSLIIDNISKNTDINPYILKSNLLHMSFMCHFSLKVYIFICFSSNEYPDCS